MSKVLVDRGALEEAAKWLEVHSSSSGSAEAFSAEALREAIAQTAEAEGAVEMGSDAWMALHLLDRLSVDSSDELRVMQIEGIVKSMGAALSAVTAERDRLDAECGRLLEGNVQDAETIFVLEAERDQLRAEVDLLRKDAERWRYVRLQGDDTHWLNMLRVDLEDFGGNVDAAVDALIDGDSADMTAKDG